MRAHGKSPPKCWLALSGFPCMCSQMVATIFYVTLEKKKDSSGGKSKPMFQLLSLALPLKSLACSHNSHLAEENVIFSSACDQVLNLF